MPLEELNEECGLAAVLLKKDLKNYPLGGASFFLQKMLLQQQNRGQLSAGITVYNSEKGQLLSTHRGIGLVSEVFKTSDENENKKILSDFSGSAGIGHTRYATFGKNTLEYVQPFERQHGQLWKWFSLGFNGNIANYSILKENLEKNDFHLKCDSDTEILMHELSQLLTKEGKNFQKIFQLLSQKLDGAYNVVLITAEGELVIVRDPKGFKPLAFVDSPDFFLAASESSALLPFVSSIQFLQPGEMLIAGKNKFEKMRFSDSPRISRCMFEWVYFSNASSSLDGRSVYQSRWNLGVELAKNETLKVNPEEYVVVCVPDTSKPAADGYAFTLKLPAMEGLLRNRYVGRTFIEGKNWADKVKDKFTINRVVTEGKKIILIDDSIVRGSSSAQIVRRLKEEGKAKEVHVRVSCPPIVSPCFYGIDMSSFHELIASKHLMKQNGFGLKERASSDEIVQKICAEIGADSLEYNSIESLVNALQLPKNELCFACLNMDYPTPEGKLLGEKAFSEFVNGEKGKKRVYEK